MRIHWRGIQNVQSESLWHLTEKGNKSKFHYVFEIMKNELLQDQKVLLPARSDWSMIYNELFGLILKNLRCFLKC